MADRIPLVVQTMYAELVDRCSIQAFARDFPPNGSFVRNTIKGRTYWYFKIVEDGTQRKKYAGPDTDQLRQRIAQHKTIKTAWRERRRLITSLKAAGMPAPDQWTGDVLSALSDAGIFRLRAVLVGTVAFQVYAPMLGVRFPGAALQTGDIDIAQFHSISVTLDDAVPSFLDMVRSADATLAPVPYALDTRVAAAFANPEGRRIELLIPNTGPDRDAPAALPALGAHGQPLRFLDFLIHEPAPAALLHGPGVLVNVPRPERYALHKLIVARRRRAGPKIEKDLQQAALLLDALLETRRHDLRDAWDELIERGPQWRKLATEGLEQLPTEVAEAAAALFEAKLPP